jgi:hypothetical protein
MPQPLAPTVIARPESGPSMADWMPIGDPDPELMGDGPQPAFMMLRSLGSSGPQPAAPVAAQPEREREPDEQAPVLPPTNIHPTRPMPVVAPAASDEVLEFWSEMLCQAEDVVDGVGGDGRFAAAFKEVLVEKAAEYPYLDPFAAEFDYREGKATYQGEPPADFSEALGDCLHDTIARLAFRLKRADLESRVRSQLSGMYERHERMIEHLSFSTQALVS